MYITADVGSAPSAFITAAPWEQRAEGFSPTGRVAGLAVGAWMLWAWFELPLDRDATDVSAQMSVQVEVSKLSSCLHIIKDSLTSRPWVVVLWIHIVHARNSVPSAKNVHALSDYNRRMRGSSRWCFALCHELAPLLGGIVEYHYTIFVPIPGIAG